MTKDQRDPWYCYEAGDRCHMVLCHLQEALNEHLALTHEEVELYETAQEVLGRLYQSVMARHFEYRKEE